MYQDGGYSPILMKLSDFPDDVIILEESEDNRIQGEDRTKLLKNAKTVFNSIIIIIIMMIIIIGY